MAICFKNCASRRFLALGSIGKTILGPREERSWTTLVQPIQRDCCVSYPRVQWFPGAPVLRVLRTEIPSSETSVHGHDVWRLV